MESNLQDHYIVDGNGTVNIFFAGEDLLNLELEITPGLPFQMPGNGRRTTAVYTGTVLSRSTQLPVPDAVVIFFNGAYQYRQKTACDGTFTLELPSFWSTVGIQISKKGYDTRYIGTYFLSNRNKVFDLYEASANSCKLRAGWTSASGK